MLAVAGALVVALTVTLLVSVFNSPAVAAATGSNKTLGAKGTQVGDFNGDGKADVLSLRRSDWAWLVSWGGTSGWEWINTGYFDVNRTWVADMDGDGKDDLFSVNADTNDWYVSYGARSSPWVKINGGYLDPANTFLGDLNGDGKSDVFYFNTNSNNEWWVSYGGTTGWQLLNGGYLNPAATWLSDMNADGKADVFSIFPDGRWFVSWSGTSGHQLLNASGATSIIDTTWMGDFDGDKKSDVLWVRPADYQWFTISGTTGHWGGWTQINGGALNLSQTWIADFNGDGKDDVFTVLDDKRWLVSYSGTSAWHQINGGELPWSPPTGQITTRVLKSPAGTDPVPGSGVNPRGTWFTVWDSKYTCGAFSDRPNWEVYTRVGGRVGNDGTFSRGYVSSGAGVKWHVSSACGRYLAKDVKSVTAKWTVKANGWGIDGCSLPASCGVGSWKDQVEFQDTWTQTSKDPTNSVGEMSLVDTFFFDAGSLGDISSIEMSASFSIQRNEGTGPLFYRTAKSGNIQ